MNDKEMKVENFRKANMDIIKGQTVLTGSSLMEMFPANKLLDEIGSDKIVYNRAVGGFVTEELMKVLDVCVFDLQPSKVFINIGTNDLSNSRIPMQKIIDNYDKIITAIEENVPNVRIYMMAYYPINYEAAAENMKECLKVRTNEKINAANAEVRKLAEKHGQRYIDISDNLKDEKGRLKAEYTIEGLHIKESGYRAIFSDFLKYLNE